MKAIKFVLSQTNKKGVKTILSNVEYEINNDNIQFDNTKLANTLTQVVFRKLNLAQKIKTAVKISLPFDLVCSFNGEQYIDLSKVVAEVTGGAKLKVSAKKYKESKQEAFDDFKTTVISVLDELEYSQNDFINVLKID